MTAYETNCQLLQRYTREGDEAAFRDLVTRHGPGVLQICRAVLRDRHAAEDAFQATFLVLVQKAPALRDPELLGEWLRGVAYRTAMHARSRAYRERIREKAKAEMAEADSISEACNPETGQIVREELGRLPEAYRVPLSLFYMEGMSQEQVAERLGLPLGTVKTRIIRGRRRLREQLERRGVGLGLALLLWLLNPAHAEAVPAGLVGRIVVGMRLAARGRRAALAARYAAASTASASS